MKVVADTNVYLSAMLFPGGNCDQILGLARAGIIEMFVSPDILTEIKVVLIKKFDFHEKEAIDVIDRVLAVSKLIYPRFRVNIIKSPAADNRILECATEAGADFLVTGDKKHILPLKKIEGSHIVSPAQFLEVMERVL